MWGMYLGMKLAWRQGLHHLQVESGSKTLVDMITGKVKTNGNPPTLVRTRVFKIELASADQSHLA
jgi:hypothetical protein